MMAGANAEDAQLSFPLPPTFYYKHYTDENVKNKCAPAPPKLASGSYALFGHMFKTDDEIIQPLESQGIKRLYSKDEHFDHISEMKKLNHSILMNYMELLDIVIEAPASAERAMKIEEIKVLFINLHHLINEFRPHQARETLRIMLHRQKLQRQETTERLKRNIEKAQAILRSCSSGLDTVTASSTTTADLKPQIQTDKKKISEELHLIQHRIMCDIVDGIS